MATICELKIEPMTEESFAPFGELWDAVDRPGDHRVISPTGYKYEGRTKVHVIWQPYDGFTFNELERHWGVTQSFIQLSGSPAVVCVAAPTKTEDPTDVPDPADVRAFLIDPAKGYSYKRGTWHSLNRHILAPPGATFVILNSDPNPTQMVNYETSTGTVYQDLGSDAKPETIEHARNFATIFEITP